LRKLDKNLKIDELSLHDGVEYEYYPNGVFLFNITKLIEYIENNINMFEKVEISVNEFERYYKNESLNQEYVMAADLSRPIILAEIAPDRLHHGYPNISSDYYSRGYNLIDGHHRLKKAQQEGVGILSAYIIRMEQHIPFMVKGLDKYIEYWNSKLE